MSSANEMKSTLSPARLVRAVRDRLPPAVVTERVVTERIGVARGPAHPDRAGRRYSVELLRRRIGLPDAALP